MEVLGLNPILLLAQLISFGVLFLVLKKFLYGNLKRSLEDRREKIRQISEKSIEVEKRIQELESKKSDMDKKNQEELRKLFIEAQKDAEGIKNKILEQAEDKSRKIIEEAYEQIEQEKEKATVELKNEAGRLASALASRILSEPTNSKKITDTSIETLEKISTRK